VVVKKGWQKWEPPKKKPQSSGQSYKNPADYEDEPPGPAIGDLRGKETAAAKPRMQRVNKAPTDGTVKVSVYLPMELDRAMRYRMADDRVTMSALVEAALVEYL
jgi:hypothetical protein